MCKLAEGGFDSRSRDCSLAPEDKFQGLLLKRDFAWSEPYPYFQYLHTQVLCGKGLSLHLVLLILSISDTHTLRGLHTFALARSF